MNTNQTSRRRLWASVVAVPTLAVMVTAGTAYAKSGGGNKGAQQVNVVGVDFAFRGVPKTVDAGREVRISFRNQGKFDHEIVLTRISDGVTDSFADILRDQTASDQETTFLGVLPASAGQQATLDFAGTLPRGRYGMACFEEDGGTPHVELGMVAELEVK